MPVSYDGNYDDGEAICSDKPWVRKVVSLSAPTVSSSTHSNSNSWYNNNDPSFSWDPVQNASIYCYKLGENSDTDPDCDNNTQNTSISFNDVADGTHYFHIKACTASGTTCSSVTHFKINVDTIAPSAPSSISASVSGSTVSLSWSGASDAKSGIKEYYVYRCTSTSTSSCSKIATTSSTSYTNSNLSNGTYYYRIKAVDNAGNISDYSSYKKVTVNVQDTGCDYSINIDVPSYVKAETITITATPSSGKLYSPTMKVKTHGKNYGERFSNYSLSGTQSKIEHSYTFSSGDDGTAYVWVVAEDDDGDSCSYTKTFIVDTTKPTISWKEPTVNATLEGEVTLKVEAKDETNADKASGIKSVSIYYIKDGKETKITSFNASSSSTYSIPWNTENLENGSYTLKAVAKDNAGNEAYAEIVVEIKNLSADAKKVENDAEELKKQFNDIKEKQTFVGKLAEKKNELEALLKDVDNAIENGDYNKASQYLESAQNMLEDLNNSSAETEFEESIVCSNIEETVAMLKEYRDEAATTTSDFNITRSFQIVKIEEKDKSYRQAVVKLKIVNTTEEEKEIQLIENIPKEFAENASMIKSNTEFEVIKADPIIKFNISVGPNEEYEIAYWLDAELDSNAAEEKKLSFENFSYAPLALPNTANITEETFYEAQAEETPEKEPTAATAAVTSAKMDWPLIIGVLVAIVIVAILLLCGLGMKSEEEPRERKRRFAYVPEEKSKEKEDYSYIIVRNRNKEGLERFRY
ncbi:MAG: hypothetical protein DRO04_01770 [Candidatus Iainarchaeum archaeon]|uniref:Fibronectin type-III domain-containing protein n=1 Tax=Candidatus Iainarchaeum sp. TaxID=3101447 RepID=A0A497JI43_9ARCH|nr:MAG: hypothetical protein DRO04_01770 [Candidatus Diapherotrites archaeon]